MIRIAIVVATAAVLLVGGAVGAGTVRWRRETRRQDAELVRRAGAEPADGAVSAGPLPAPVARYLRRAAPDSLPDIRIARIEQAGEFLLREPDGWAPFTATQLFTAAPPALLWNARIRMAPLVDVHVRDLYSGGRGGMRGAVAGVVNVVDAAGPRIAEAALVRYLAEAPWLPTRLRPSATLRWSPVDDSTAVATLTDEGLRADVEFRFDADGDIRAMRVGRRYRGGDPEWAAWTGRYDAYETFDGYRIPTRCVVSWVIDGRERPYWKGTVESVVYETR